MEYRDLNSERELRPVLINFYTLTTIPSNRGVRLKTARAGRPESAEST